MVAKKVEAAFDPANERLLGMFLPMSGKRVERSKRGAPGKFDWLEDLSVDELRAFIDGKLDIESYRQGDAAVPRRPFIRKSSFN
jgi:hypothetical protein